jgi:hypothetical protein
MADRGASRPAGGFGSASTAGSQPSATLGRSGNKPASKQKPHDAALASIVGSKVHMQKMWDAGELLNDSQKEALASLGQLASERRLPVEEWHIEDTGQADSDVAEAKAISVAELFQKLAQAETMEVESDLLDVTEHYRRLKDMLALADAFLDKLDSVDGALKGLQEQHDTVVHKTSALHSECEQLLQEKTEMEALANGIQSKLVHYDELENLQRSLSAPSFQVYGRAMRAPMHVCTVDKSIYLNITHACVLCCAQFLNET